MEATKNSTIIRVIGGALLIAGLFFFFSRKTELENSEATVQSIPAAEKVAALKNDEPINNEPAQISIEKTESFKPSIQVKGILSVVDEIIQRQNDNDPRVNSELKNLSQQVHEALYEKYDSYAAENRNAKGFIVFLVAQDIKSVADVEFVTKIYQEAPCLSLEDCKNVGSGDPHHSGANQTTLIYPQFVGLYQLEQQLQQKPDLLKDSVMRQSIENLLKRAEDFPVPAIQDRARQLRRKFGL